MRFSIRSRTSSEKVRTVPCSSHASGTTLVASPAWIMVTERTPASTGFLLRLMMVWNACTIWQATGMGSMPLCGRGARLPPPRLVVREAGAGAPTILLGWLEDQVDVSIEVAVSRQLLGCGQQHGGMPIVPTGVHLAGVLARMRQLVEPFHGGSRHVGSQPP